MPKRVVHRIKSRFVQGKPTNPRSRLFAKRTTSWAQGRAEKVLKPLLSAVRKQRGGSPPLAHFAGRAVLARHKKERPFRAARRHNKGDDSDDVEEESIQAFREFTQPACPGKENVQHGGAPMTRAQYHTYYNRHYRKGSGKYYHAEDPVGLIRQRYSAREAGFTVVRGHRRCNGQWVPTHTRKIAARH